ncbi:hypothetical protein [Trueperella pecoris]|uniref:primosomal protein N' family DNA-binding protein n=1 Tax=Trueperella pecoris TaxID=2733571 RepID=UPI001ABE7BF3|nr:hypothetical protein [Trueperella pecoris]QTG76352.1 hypothetical protein J4179_04805 [Trueperella pecoris]
MTTNAAGGLFNLPEFGHQEELLSLSPLARELDSGVDRPVARVLLDMPQPHMDRLFDYEIPEKMAGIEEGARVKVDVGSRVVDGFVIERSETTAAGRLRPLRRVVSPMAVLTPEVFALCRTVAARQAAPTADAVRLAVPQRHARAEKEFAALPERASQAVRQVGESAWDHYIGGPEFAAQLRAGRRPSAVVQLRARDRAQHFLPFLISTIRQADESVIVVVPTPVVARRLAALIEQEVGQTPALMVSEDDHATRYATFLSVLSGRAKVIVGTRSAAWAPAQDLGMVVLIDDHHSALTEQRSPYVHAREVLAIRAELSGCSFVSLDYGPSAELAVLVQRGKAQWITPAASAHRDGVAQIMSANDFRSEGVELSRMPSAVFAVARDGLERGPVLFVVPRAGYIPLTACQNCREIASCPQCAGPLSITHLGAPLVCSRCSLRVSRFVCSSCHGTQVRAVRIGSQRTAHEIGRAFRDVPIHVAGVGQQVGELDASRRIVVATPGVPPSVEGGYAAAIVLDSGYLLRSNRLEAEVHFLRTLAHVAALVCPRSSGGKLLIVGDVPSDLVAALHTWDMAGWTSILLAERAEIGLPPTSCWVELRGSRDSLREFLGLLRAVASEQGFVSDEAPLDALLAGGARDVIAGLTVLGPHAAGDALVAYLRFAESERAVKTAAIYTALREASAKKLAHGLRVTVDPAL